MATIDDILREMRKDIPRVVDAKVILRNYANRIEAAIKREREATCKDSLQVGNAAKMREALKYLRDASREFCHLIVNSKYNEVYDKYKYAEVAKIRDAIANANATLSAIRRRKAR
jgi:hypothetical protein